MKIAIIENDEQHINNLKNELSNWDIDFFFNTIQFGFTNIKDYDAIIADYSLDTMSGRDLINSLANKTTAQLFLMNSEKEKISDEDIQNQNIAGVINKNDISSFIDQIKYVDIKLRINKIMENEQTKIDEMLNEKEYKIEVKENYLMIELIKILSDSTKFVDELRLTKKNKSIIYFNKLTNITSPYLANLVFVYKFFKQKHGNLVFWNSSQEQFMIELLKSCKLDLIFKIFNDLNEAIDYLEKN